MTAAGMVPCGDGAATWRGRTEIDHVLAGVGIANRIRNVEVMREGLRRTADHAIVTADLLWLKSTDTTRASLEPHRPRRQTRGASACVASVTMTECVWCVHVVSHGAVAGCGGFKIMWYEI